MAKHKYVTPIGTGRYCWIKRPDTQFDADGVYGTHLILSEKDAAPLLELLKEVAEDSFTKKVTPSFPVSRDEETGDVIFRTKSKYQPKVVDASGAPILENDIPDIYSGSRLRLRGQIKPFTVQGKSGLTMYVEGVQIVELASGSDAGGFDSVEGGFVMEKAANDRDTSFDDNLDDAFNF